jgi:hypothetical protein
MENFPAEIQEESFLKLFPNISSWEATKECLTKGEYGPILITFE